MSTETKPLSPLAKLALAQHKNEITQATAKLVETIAADAGLKPDDGWQFDFKTECFTRETPDISPSE